MLRQYEDSEIAFLLSSQEVLDFINAAQLMASSHPELLNMDEEELEIYLAPIVTNALYDPRIRTPRGDCDIEKADFALSMVVTIISCGSGNAIACGLAIINMGIRGEALGACEGN